LNYAFDRLGWLEHEGHLNRKSLFLDLNFWIQLSEPNHEQLKVQLSHLVETGKLICPVSPSILMELFKRTRGTHRDNTSQLMDQLSKGLALRGVDTTFRHEFAAALDGRQAERQVAYSYFRDTFPPVFTLLFPEQGMEMSITDFINGRWSSVLETNASGIEQRLVKGAQQENEWRRDNKSTRKKVEEEEWIGTFRALNPAMLIVFYEKSEQDATLRKLFLETQNKILARSYHTLRRELRDKLDSCRSFWCHYQCMTELRWHKPVRENDIWDFLHVAMAVPYVDCLATDGSAKSIVCAGTLGMAKKFGTRVISQENDLIDWLKDM
jgi:hypothetical protein